MRIKPALKVLISNIFPIFYTGTATIQEHPKRNLTFEVEPQVYEDVPPFFQANRDREGPHGLPPPTPSGIRITYQGGSVDYSGPCETSRVFS